jgi:hypothetical protein
MTVAINDEQLQRAVANIERLRSFFTSRTTWRVNSVAAKALASLHQALANTIQFVVEPMLRQYDIEPAKETAGSRAEPFPAGELEAHRLQRFTAFIDQFGEWLAAQTGKGVSDHGREHLRTLHGSLSTIAGAVEEILRCYGIDFSPLRPVASAKHISDQILEEAFEEDGEEDGPNGVPVGLATSRLVLEDTEATPLIQTFKGKTELTHDAKQEIEGFLSEAGVGYQGSDLTRFQHKVRQWIEGTPQDHVLVIKVSALSGHPQPYPSYARKSSPFG